MRIIAGDYRNRQICAPAGRDVRPTPEKAREALFSVLGGSLEGHTFLDLYAGAGTMGLEAVSRGAELAIFVEQNRRAIAALSQNIRALHCEARCEVLEMPVGSVTREVYEQATVIFLDPPYGTRPSLPRLHDYLETAQRTPLIIYQWDSRLGPRGGERMLRPWIPDRMSLLEERLYGRTAFSLFYQEED